jgi:hypothetical protein
MSRVGMIVIRCDEMNQAKQGDWDVNIYQIVLPSILNIHWQ